MKIEPFILETHFSINKIISNQLNSPCYFLNEAAKQDCHKLANNDELVQGNADFKCSIIGCLSA